MPWNILAHSKLLYVREAPPHALDQMMMNVPSRNKCRLPHIRADGTHSMPAIPTPKRKYPVSSAIFVNLTTKTKESVIVFAARIGPRDVAKIATTERIMRITSRFHSGQF